MDWVRFFSALTRLSGGRGGIRTHGRLSPTAVFKTAALNHSATLPAVRPERRALRCTLTRCAWLFQACIASDTAENCIRAQACDTDRQLAALIWTKLKGLLAMVQALPPFSGASACDPGDMPVITAREPQIRAAGRDNARASRAESFRSLTGQKPYL